MDFQGVSTKRVEALLNEYKGNLYEFLVAKALSRSFGLEETFLSKLSDDVFGMLSVQEGFIRSYYPALIGDLNALALEMANELSLIACEALYLESRFCDVILVGKISDEALRQKYGEADLLLIKSDASALPLSIKLSRKDSYVNSKSAGVKSFLSKYFSSFFEIGLVQEKFNDSFDQTYRTMAWNLQELKGLEPDFEFKSWKDHGFSELPGSLDDECRALFLRELSSMNNLLYDCMNELFERDPKQFKTSLLPLIGITSPSMVQATTYYEKNERGGYSGVRNHIESARDILLNLRVLELINNKNKTSFDIIFEDRVLQIRLKAMNKFTAKGYKVNCAFKLRF